MQSRDPLDPGNAKLYNERGNAEFELRRYEAAIASYDAAIARNPGFAGGHYNRASALYQLGRFESAIAGFDRAIALDPAHARAHNYRGKSLRELGRIAQALASFAAAIAVKPDYADVHQNLGDALFELERYAAALQSYDRVIALQPSFPDAHNGRGNALCEMGRFAEALASYEAAIGLDPLAAGFHFNRAQMLDELRQHAAAAASYDRTLALKADFKYAPGHRLLARMHSCDWRGYAAALADLDNRIARGESAATPFAMLALSGSAPLQRKAAERWVCEKAPPSDALPAIPRRTAGAKIRIGYFSPDFGDHPVSRLTAELFESHDRTRFEITAFSFGADARDPMRRRLERAFDRFIDVRGQSATDIALLARRLQIDIAVDLAGFTQGCRPKIFALRAAPVQVSYIGHLGTMGAPYMDYVIADAALVPPAERGHYAESIVYLPSYQANDSKRAVADRMFLREELGLPPSRFVFCCFNANYKITPPTFDVWMRILSQTPGSVLFLYAGDAAAAEQLRQEARARGIDAGRLIFGGRLRLPEYLARYRAADLFLDTLPYNAGATASDALWMGLPVLTCAGESFAGRVGASLLQAICLPELVTSSAAQYAATAVALAADAERLAAIKRRLLQQRLTAPLFDTPAHTRSLEAAYMQMQARALAELPPEDIHIKSVHGTQD